MISLTYIKLSEEDKNKIKEVQKQISLDWLVEEYAKINQTIDIVKEDPDSLVGKIDQGFDKLGYDSQWIKQHEADIGEELTSGMRHFVDHWSDELPEYIARFGMTFMNGIMNHTPETIEKFGLDAKLNFSVIFALYIKKTYHDESPLVLLEELGVLRN